MRVIGDIIANVIRGVPGKAVDRVNHQAGLFIAHQCRQVQPHPAGFFGFRMGKDSIQHILRCVPAQAQQAVRIGTRAGTAAARLNAVQIRQEPGEKLVTHPAAPPVAHQKGKDRQGPGAARAQQFKIGIARPDRKRPRPQIVLPRCQPFVAQGLLDHQHEPGADIADHVGRAAFFAVLQPVRIDMPPGRHEGNRATAGQRRGAAPRDRIAQDHHARGPRPAGKLVRRKDHCVLFGVGAAVHPHRQVRGGAAIVPDRQRAMTLQQPRHRDIIGNDAGHVRCRAERADDQAGALCIAQRGFERAQNRPAFRGFGDLDHLGAAFAPRQQVRMMLIRPDKNDGALPRRQNIGNV